MFENKTEKEARKEILKIVEEYCNKYHNKNKEFKEEDRICYAARVYDSKEMVNLVDSSLEFWLTSGRFTKVCKVLKCKILLLSKFRFIS